MDDVTALTITTKLSSLITSIDQLGETIAAQGIGVSEKLDVASARIERAVKTASDASELHARSLAKATWALVSVTIVLVFITAVHAYIAFVHT